MDCSTCDFSYDDKIEYLCPSCGRYETVNLFPEIPIYISFLKDLNNKTARLIDKLKAKNISVDDFRRTKLGAFNIVTLATIFDLRDYDNDIRYNDSRIPSVVAKSNPQLSQERMKDLIESIDIRNRMTYLVISLFQFENLFVELAKKLDFHGMETYSNVVNHVIKNLDLKDKTEKLDSLILPSIVRNTLHSAGVYRNLKNKVRELKVKNISFKFEHNKPHSLASWREIIFYLDNVIETTDEILSAYTDKRA